MQHINLAKDFAKNTLNDWENQLKKDLSASEFEKLASWNEIEEIRINAIHTQETGKINHLIPGQFPYTRGNSLITKPLNNVQTIDIENEDESNRLALELLMTGCNSLRFNLSSKENIQFERLFLNIEFQFIKCYITIQNLNQYYELKNYFNSEFPGELIICYDHLNVKNEELFSAMIKDLAKKQMFSLEVAGNNIQASGASAYQEIAFCISTGLAYLEDLMERGFTIDEASACIHFSIGIGSNYLIEIAKIRSLRKIWSFVLSKYSPKHNCSFNCNLKAVIGTLNKSRFDSNMNLIRQTTESISAIIGGVENIEITTLGDESASELKFSRRMAINIPLILSEESYLNNTIDALGGSYVLEHLCIEIENKSWSFFQNIQRKGGIFNQLALDFLSQEILKKAQLRIEKMLTGEDILIGINKYQSSSTELDSPISHKFYLGIPDLNLENEYLKAHAKN